MAWVRNLNVDDEIIKFVEKKCLKTFFNVFNFNLKIIRHVL